MSAVSSGDAWAVGSYYAPDDLFRPINQVQHWDGGSWRPVDGPTGRFGSVLNAVAAITADDVWAVGEALREDSHTEKRVWVQHWDGEAWSRSVTADLGVTVDESLQAVDAVGRTMCGLLGTSMRTRARGARH